MKRGFPQKVKPVVSSASSNDATVDQLKQTPLGANRKARTSAAMIGLALSMGASSLLLPRQDDGAAAAEPLAMDMALPAVPQASQSVNPLVVEEAIASPLSQSVVSDIRHTVQDGQSLWQIARKHRVSVIAIAEANNISPEEVIVSGQSLRIPLSQKFAESASSRVEGAVVSTPETTQAGLDGLNSDIRGNAVVSQADVKAQRDEALARLRQQQDKLRASLTEVRTADEIATDSKSTARSFDTTDGVVHRVRSGETLNQIALTYGVSQETLVSVNQLSNPNWLRTHQSLIIPTENELPSGVPTLPTPVEVEQTVQRPVAETVYRVASGDTIYTIARSHSVAPEALIAANQLSDPNFIRSGQTLSIPVAASLRQVTSATTIASAANAERAANEANTIAALPQSTGYVSISAPTVPAAETILPGDVEPIVATPPSEPSETQLPASQQVAVAPLSAPASAQSDSDVAPNPFVQNLLTEVRQLRERHRSTASSGNSVRPAVEVAAASEFFNPAQLPSSDAVNPQLVPQAEVAPEAIGTIQSVSARPTVPTGNFSGITEIRSPEPEAAPVAIDSATVRRPQVVAVAPVPTEAYTPLLQPITGNMVSPDLPPLPGAEQFLPNGSSRFGGYIWPSRGVFTSGYGWRWGRMHRGIDIAAPVGTPVHAAASGVVHFSGWNSGGYGNMVEIRHADGSMTRYAHHSRNLVRAGQRVEQGQQIAQIGSTGFSTGPHLHFEIHLPNQGTVNPIAYLPR